MSCLKCSKSLKRTISLICDHILCYSCASLSLQLDVLNERQKKYKLKCPKCKKLTYTYDLQNLLIKEEEIGTRLSFQESFEDFVSLTSRQKITPKYKTRKNSNIQYEDPMITLCQENQQNFPVKNISQRNFNVFEHKTTNREMLLTKILCAKKKLEQEYSNVSQNVTDQFYLLNRILTKHRQNLMNQVDSVYKNPINCLKIFLNSLSESSYIIPMQLSQIQRAIDEIESSSYYLQKLSDQTIDNFLKNQLCLVHYIPDGQINIQQKQRDKQRQRETEDIMRLRRRVLEDREEYRNSAPLRSRDNQMSGDMFLKNKQNKFSDKKENNQKFTRYRMLERH